MDEPIDYNALDDGLAGQIAQAAFIAAFYAVPDVCDRRGSRVAAWLGLGAANLAAIAIANAFDEDPRNDLTQVVEHAPEDTAGPGTTWAVLGGALAATVGAAALTTKVHGSIARWLRRRGIAKPHTAMGVVAGAGYLAAKQLS